MGSVDVCLPILQQLEETKAPKTNVINLPNIHVAALSIPRSVLYFKGGVKK